jgi:hypothetical protein
MFEQKKRNSVRDCDLWSSSHLLEAVITIIRRGRYYSHLLQSFHVFIKAFLYVNFVGAG